MNTRLGASQMIFVVQIIFLLPDFAGHEHLNWHAHRHWLSSAQILTGITTGPPLLPPVRFERSLWFDLDEMGQGTEIGDPFALPNRGLGSHMGRPHPTPSTASTMRAPKTKRKSVDENITRNS